MITPLQSWLILLLGRHGPGERLSQPSGDVHVLVLTEGYPRMVNQLVRLGPGLGVLVEAQLDKVLELGREPLLGITKNSEILYLGSRARSKWHNRCGKNVSEEFLVPYKLWVQV
jgi:hypothetical protein